MRQAFYAPMFSFGYEIKCFAVLTFEHLDLTFIRNVVPVRHWYKIKRASCGVVGSAVALLNSSLAYAGDGTPVTSMTTIRTAATPSGSYNIGGNIINYGIGDNVRITSVNVGALSLTRSAISKPNIKINRVNNPNVSGDRMTLFYPGLISGATINIEGTEALTI